MRAAATLLVLSLVLPPDRARQEAKPFRGGAAELSAVRTDPGRFLGAELTFALQLQRLDEDWDPFLSRFGPDAWLGVVAWPDESFTWDPHVFAHPATRLFVRRTSPLGETLRRARTYARFEARAFVREIFLGEPWIEIVALQPLPDAVVEGTILHVGQARELASEGQWELALEQYERAKAAPLPPHALAALEREVQAARAAFALEQATRGKRLRPSPARPN